MVDETSELNPEYQEWLSKRAHDEAAARATTSPVEEPHSTGAVSEDAIKRMIEQALERQQKKHDTEMQRLRDEITTLSAQLPLGLVPEHSGGIGVDNIANTWSLYDQELARRGEHPHQQGKHADWLEHPDFIDVIGAGTNTKRLRRDPDKNESESDVE